MMGRGQVSVGDDTPTGEPENGPRGPYITDEEEDISKPRSKEDSDQRRSGNKPSRTETEITKKSELGSDR